MKKIFILLALFLGSLPLSADDIYVKMTSTDEIDTNTTYLLVSGMNGGKSIGNNVITGVTIKDWYDSSGNYLSIPDNYSGLLYIQLEAIDAANHVYAMKIRGSSYYISNSNSTYLTTVNSCTSRRAQWVVTKHSDGLILKSYNNSSYVIKQKGSRDFFCTASTSSTYKSVILFKKLPPTETITIGSAGYTTFVPANTLDFSEQTNVTPYVVTQASATAAILESLENVPAKTPIVVKGSEGSYDIPVTTATSTVESNLLIASDGTVPGDGKTVYALGNLSAGVGFYLVDTDVIIPNGRCYLRVNQTDQAPQYMRMTVNHTTGIDEYSGITDYPYYYSLSGQRLIHPRKGIYIYKGKKIVIK